MSLFFPFLPESANGLMESIDFKAVEKNVQKDDATVKVEVVITADSGEKSVTTVLYKLIWIDKG